MQVDDRGLRGLTEHAVNVHGGNGVVVAGKKAQIVLQTANARARAAKLQEPGVLLGDLLQTNALGIQLIEPLDACINGLNSKPGRATHHTVWSEVEDLLKRAHGRLGVLHEYAVRLHDFGDGGIVLRDAVETDLYRAHVVAHVANAKREFGHADTQTLHGHVGDNVNVVPEIGGQNLIGGEPLVGKIHRAPLRKTVALYLNAVAVSGKQRLNAALAADVAVEDLTRDLADVVENVTAVDKGLINGGGVGDVKIITARAVILGVNAVERKGNLCVHVGSDGVFRPIGVDFRGCYVHDVVDKGNGHVLRRRIR